MNGIPPSFFLLLHLVGFVAAAYFAHRAFSITLNLAGWGFTLFALGELIYMTYHIDVTVLLFANTVATLLDVVAIAMIFAGAVKSMRVVRITEIEQVYVEAAPPESEPVAEPTGEPDAETTGEPHPEVVEHLEGALREEQEERA